MNNPGKNFLNKIKTFKVTSEINMWKPILKFDSLNTWAYNQYFLKSHWITMNTWKSIKPPGKNVRKNSNKKGEI